ncbi:MAG: hypothetical protein ACRC30_06840 [Clostridium sp.]
MKIEINIDVLTKLRDTINSEQNISYNKSFMNRKKEVFCAWDKICAIMDRLDDTVEYLNDLELNTNKYNRSAFDFYDFMNNGAVVVDCVRALANIFEVDMNEIKSSSNIFNQLGNDGKGTDERYFEYLRSLCSVHPIETSRHERYQENKFECSPYVSWNKEIFSLYNDGDLNVKVYTSKDGELGKNIPIYVSQIFEYIKTRVQFISKIIERIEEYHKTIIEEFKNKKIKKKDEFENYIEYLENLEKETKERIGEWAWHSFEKVIKLLKLNVVNSENKRKMNLYIEALKYSIEFQYNSLQNMSESGFKNNGLKYEENNIQTTLYYELYSPNSKSDEVRKYGYNIEKISYLEDGSGDSDKRWAYMQIEKAKNFFEKYITFEEAQSDLEYYALCKLALYLDCLENNCMINKNIPNDLKYREKLLSEKKLRN